MQDSQALHALRYRPDVDGLRAAAVVPVVLFHAGLLGVTGGYVGVDVFFVISGYLITNIIVRDLEGGRFSISRFYERRVRRILPALFLVVAATMVAGFALFVPREFAQFGQSVIATVLFISNVFFFDKADYFATATDQKPLLHTWSLAVEEQFYIFHPLLLPLILKYFRRPNVVVAAVAVVSFVLSVILVNRYQTAAFYLTPPRVWELLVGALIALGAVPKIRNRVLNDGLALVGLAAIFASTLLYTSETRFPGLAALVPVLGAALVIHTGQDGKTFVARLLSLPLIVGLGLISYSLYLWHWPLITFSEYYLMRPITSGEAVWVVAASVVLAYLSWRYVETPFRRPNGVFVRTTLFKTAATVGTVFALAGLTFAVTRGLPGRLPPELAEIMRFSSATKKSFTECQRGRPSELSNPDSCRIGAVGEAPPSFVLWGDSHAAAFASAVDAVAARHGLSGMMFRKPGCAPLIGLKFYGRRVNKRCDGFNTDVYAYIQAHKIRRVVMVARWAVLAKGTKYKYEAGNKFQLSASGVETNADVFDRLLESTVKALIANDVEVLIVGPVPEVGLDVPSVMVRAKWWGQVLPDLVPKAEFLDRQKEVLAALARIGSLRGVQVVYPHDILCDDIKCRIDLDGRPLYSDDDHISALGGKTISSLIDGTLQRWSASAANHARQKAN